MKSFLFVFLFFFCFDVKCADIYIAKRDIDSNIYVNDCDFVIYDSSGNVVDSWVQDNSYHVSNLKDCIYTLVERPYISDTFNDSLSNSYKLNVSNDKSFEFNLYNKKIDTPRNLGVSYNSFYGFLFILFDILIIKFCKFKILQSYNITGDTMGKEEFKNFVRSNPSLIKYVRDGSKTWQNFYELFSLYGDDSSVWKEYLNKSSSSQSMDFVSWIKSIDVDSIQDGVASIQRVLGVVQDFTGKESVDEQYSPRPLYKHFED